MRDPKRIKRIIAKLQALWLKNPDLRFCQLLENVTTPSPIPTYNLEDENLEVLINQYSKQK